MKITGYQTSAIGVPVSDTAIRDAVGTYVVLRLRTDEGIEGIGYASGVSPSTVRSFIGVLEEYLDQLIGWNPLASEAISTPRVKFGTPGVFRRSGSWPGYQTRAARTIDVALWDIKGKVANMPVYQLMGGFRDRVPCYASWRIEPGTADALDLGTSARFLVDQGFRAMKFHVRTLDHDGTVRHMRELREAVGPDIDIMVDNYQGWDLKQSLRMADALAPYNPYWIEDPLPLEDFEGMRQLRDAMQTYLCAGEQYRDLVSFRRLLEHRSVDITMVDLDLGLTGFLKVAHLAEAFGVPVVSHLATEVMAHAVAAVPNGLTVEYVPWASPMFHEALQVDGGEIVLPQRPGLGLELDEAALRKLALD